MKKTTPATAAAGGLHLVEGAPKPTAKVERITPAQAKEYLRTNTQHNRKLNSARVAAFREDMKAGRWQLNGETVIFDVNGALIDGQHRMLACVQADTAFETYVARGVAEASFQSIDTAGVRSKGDVLGISGEKYRNELASGLRLLFEWEAGRPFSKGGGMQARLTNTQVLEFLERHPGMRTCAAFASGRKHLANLLPRSLTTVLLYRFRQKDDTLAELFFDTLETGENLSSTSPIRVLRERLVVNRGNKAKLPPREIAALTIKAWNAERSGRPMRALRWTDGEDFPEVL